MQPTVTIFCAFTRKWAVDRWLQNLDSLGHDRSRTNLAFIVDTDEPEIRIKLKHFAQRNKYRDFRIIMNTDHMVNEVRVNARRLRIVDMKNQSRELIDQLDGDYVFSLEDDTVFGGHDLLNLLYAYRDEQHGKRTDIGFIEGVQAGRWGVKMLGAWTVDDPSDPRKVYTMLPNKYRRFQQISAGGFYGYVTRKDWYTEHEYHWDGEPWGPDVNFGLWLRRQNVRCMIDWKTVFGHNDHNVIIYPDGKLAQVVYTLKNGHWERKDIWNEDSSRLQK